jgi:hypothetical protein
MSVHPVIRILCFLILVTFLARMHLPEMLVLSFCFFVFAFKNFTEHMRVLFRFVMRLRWFWLSILLLYSFMPLDSTEVGTQSLAPHLAGLWEGLLRCFSLLLVIMYFVVLVHPIALVQLRQAWYWLMRPLKIIGIAPDLISLRIALSFHAVRELQAQSVRPEHKLNFRQLPERLYDFMQIAIEKSANQTGSIEDSCPLPAPSLRQWVIPLVLLTALIMLVHYRPLPLEQYFNW